MAGSSQLSIAALPHPDRDVRALGFDVTHPYVELCWGAVIGPSATMILRRLPMLWAERDPVVADADELGRSLGLHGRGARAGTFGRALDRLTNFQLATWIETGESIGVYTHVPALSTGRLQRLPRWTQHVHSQLLTASRVVDGVDQRPAMATGDRGRLAAYVRASNPGAPTQTTAGLVESASTRPPAGRTPSK
jgi:hypothetical protein